MSNQLIEAQRYEIYLGLKSKWSIAGEIGVSKSTVYCEIRRKAKADGNYVYVREFGIRKGREKVGNLAVILYLYGWKSKYYKTHKR